MKIFWFILLSVFSQICFAQEHETPESSHPYIDSVGIEISYSAYKVIQNNPYFELYDQTPSSFSKGNLRNSYLGIFLRFRLHDIERFEFFGSFFRQRFSNESPSIGAGLDYVGNDFGACYLYAKNAHVLPCLKLQSQDGDIRQHFVNTNTGIDIVEDDPHLGLGASVIFRVPLSHFFDLSIIYDYVLMGTRSGRYYAMQGLQFGILTHSW